MGTKVQIKIFALLCLESETDLGIVMSCCWHLLDQGTQRLV